MKLETIIAYIFSVGTIVFLYIISQQNKKSKLLLCKLIADIALADERRRLQHEILLG